MPGAKDTAKILSHLRGLMREVQIAEVAGGLSAYIVPSSDAHSSEYISERDKRRQFVSGFTGSAGTAVITQDKALLWTDGRYFLQASQELDEANWQLMKDGLVETPSIGEWLCRNLPTSSVVGIDTTLYEEDLYLSLANKLRENRLRLFHTKQNLVDLVWNNRPLQELKPLIQLNISDYGKSTQEKLKSIREQMKSLNVYATVVTSLDEIAWLLNIRGFDIPYGAVFFAYVLITETNLKVFTDLTRLDSSSPTIRQDLCQQAGENLEFGEYGHFYQFIEEFMSKEIVQANRKVFLSGQTNHFIHSLVPHDLVHKDMSLVNKLKIIKNANEIEAAKRVHVRDSVTLVELFYKLDKQFDPNSNNRNHFDGMELTELSVSDYLDQFRATKPGFLTPSFETICGFGSNGAIIHYKPHPNEKNKTIESNNLLLIDSGGHYSDMGTTDVTRTVYLGDKSTISDYQRECFTRVLKGHIQLALRIFPVNTRSELLDSFARQALWNVGLDYSHGTGHGVGALLNVHEVPIIGNRKSIELGLQENMIVTIEPGYYENDKFGIRIENCVLAVKAAKKYKYASNVDFLTFEPLTYVPIQRELIDKSLLDADELNWLNSYHTKCAELIGPELKKAGQNDVYEWLLEQTKPI